MGKEIFDKEYKRLNKAQKQAVDEVYWPIMIVAWPGTGKTQIIWLRTANIILKAWVNPENILITTFTDAWVIAIRERLLKFLWTDSYKVWVSTIHSFSQEVIKTFPEKFTYYKASESIDEVESLEIIKNLLEKLIGEEKIVELTNDYDKLLYLRDIKSRISSLKWEWISSLKLKQSIENQVKIYKEELSEIKPTLKKYETSKIKQEKHIKKLEELTIIFEEYNNYLRENWKYDFNDMINFVLEKFMEDDELKYYYAEQFQFIMLDEYQDTNNAQNEIINTILSVSEEKPNIMVVWDDDQSIYRFQWANIENMLDFSKYFKDTKFIVLTENYRSSQDILDLSSNFIKNNSERLSNKINNLEKNLISSWDLNSFKNKPKLFRASSDIEEKTFIINEIKNRKEEVNEIAIIVRNNREVMDWTKTLQQNNIEVESKLKTDILKSNYIELIINYLKIIEDPYVCERSIINLLRTDIVWIKQVDIFKINRELYIKNYSRKVKLCFSDYLFDEYKLESLDLLDKDALLNFRDNLEYFSKNLKQKSFIDFFWDFIEKTWILEYIEKNWNFDDIEDILTFSNKIKDWNKQDKVLNITKLVEKIELYKSYNYPITRQIIRKSKTWVQVLTAHNSKWLEFETVFIPWLYYWNWENKRIPDRLKLPEWIVWEWIQKLDSSQIEEDRRLFFVAVTRAKKNLFLSFPAWIDIKPLIASSFIEEIDLFYETLDLGVKKEDIKEAIENNLKNNLITYSNLEFDYIEEFLQNYKLSPSDLNSFLEDPLEFLNRVIFKYPFNDNEFTIFGSVYHRTLELFYLKYKKDLKLPEKSYLSSTFTYLLEKEILTPTEFEKLKEKWIKWLEWYYDLYSTKTSEPLLLEYKFRWKNIIFEDIPLTWTIDKVEKIWEAEPWEWEWQLAFFKDKVALIDYKTGKSRTENSIKWLDRNWNKKPWEWKYFRQLLFYKLLCELDRDFTSKFDIWSLAIDFVEWRDEVYKYIEVSYTNEEYEEFKQEIRNSWEKIKDINFWKKLLWK